MIKMIRTKHSLLLRPFKIWFQESVIVKLDNLLVSYEVLATRTLFWVMVLAPTTARPVLKRKNSPAL